MTTQICRVKCVAMDSEDDCAYVTTGTVGGLYLSVVERGNKSQIRLSDDSRLMLASALLNQQLDDEHRIKDRHG